MTSRDDAHAIAGRIGGEFELTEADLRAPGGARLPSFGRPHELWCDTGRSALALAGQDILRRGGRGRIWIPAYCCESVVQPFRELGFDIAYYPTGQRLNSDGAHLPQPAPGETLLFIHYFGHRNTALAAHAVDLRRNDVRVIEDCVQAAFTERVGRVGDYAVASYRKLLPQPDGALLSSDRELDGGLREADEAFISQRVWGKLLRGWQAPSEQFLPWFESSERLLDARVVPRSASWMGTQLLLSAQIPEVCERRCSNWRLLAERLVPLIRAGSLAPVCAELGAGEVPLGLPVTVDPALRDPLRRFLAANDVFCPIHWPLAHIPQEPRFAAEHVLARSVITLPIDQRMSCVHIERFAHLLIQFFGVRS